MGDLDVAGEHHAEHVFATPATFQVSYRSPRVEHVGQVLFERRKQVPEEVMVTVMWL
jgi:hypothetical protein